MAQEAFAKLTSVTSLHVKRGDKDVRFFNAVVFSNEIQLVRGVCDAFGPLEVQARVIARHSKVFGHHHDNLLPFLRTVVLVYVPRRKSDGCFPLLKYRCQCTT